MKIRTFVICGLAALTYIGTILISIDQIKERDASIKVKDEKIATLSEGLDRLSKESAKIKNDQRSIMQALYATKASVEEKSRQADALAQLGEEIKNVVAEQSPDNSSISLQENAKRQIQARKEILETMQQPAAGSVSYSSQNSGPLASGAAPWVPPTQATASKVIKDKAYSEWKDNYRMVNYSIEKETAAFNKLLQYNKTGNLAVKTQLAKAAQEWPNNYSMMVYSLETQLEAKQKLDGK